MRSRCWNLRMNLDTFNAAFAALDGSLEQSEFLVGMSRGMNGGKVKDDCSEAMSVGFHVGMEMRGEAESFRERSVVNGGRRKSNKNDQKVDQTVYQNGTQSTIHNPQSTKRQKKAPLTVCPAEFESDLQAIIDNWPSKTMYRNGAGAWEPARVTKLHTPDHLWERMLKFCPGENTTLLINCAISYLNDLFERDKVDGKITNVCAMTNFYGEKAIWKRFVGDAQEDK